MATVKKRCIIIALIVWRTAFAGAKFPETSFAFRRDSRERFAFPLGSTAAAAPLEDRFTKTSEVSKIVFEHIVFVNKHR